MRKLCKGKRERETHMIRHRTPSAHTPLLRIETRRAPNEPPGENASK